LRFFVGLHHPNVAGEFDAAFISVRAIEKRKGPFPVNDWVMDSGAFTTISQHGKYLTEPHEYAAQIKRWSTNGSLLAAVTQDYMCEPHIIAKTGLSVPEHQRMTVERYDALMACDLGGVYLMPVLQGWMPDDYLRHLEMYGDRIGHGAWVGVGSVCKRNRADNIAKVLRTIKAVRPDLRLHGFGATLTALQSPLVQSLLYTADSMAWSFAARREGRDSNSKHEAHAFVARVNGIAEGWQETADIQERLFA
jgi:hypothetical protein